MHRRRELPAGEQSRGRAFVPSGGLNVVTANRKPRRLIATTLVLLAVLVTGCGGGGSTSGATKTVSGQQPRAGQSCAELDPITGRASLPPNIDCDVTTKRFVEAGGRCDFATYLPMVGHVVCGNDGRLVQSTPISGRVPRVGQSCAGFNPMRGSQVTWPANIDCDLHTHRYVAEGTPCNVDVYRSAGSHLVCWNEKLVRPESIPSIHCKIGETRTVGGMIEKCVPAPPVSPPSH